MNKKLPEIQESLLELKLAMSQEKCVKIYRRLQALVAAKSRLVTTRTAIAALLGVHRKTVGRWFALYERQGLQAFCTVNTHPNRSCAILGFVFNELENRLSTPQGFSSYGAIGRWLHTEFGLLFPYKTIHATVHNILKATPKVPRPSNIQKDAAAERQFRQTGFQDELQLLSSEGAPGQPVRVWAQDETRFGLMTRRKRVITLRGIKPIGPYQHRFQNFYIYGAVEPRTGQDFYVELPTLDTACFQVFLAAFARAFPASFHILLLDRGTFHRTHTLLVPQNIRLLFQPAHCPELNPIERVWQHLKEQLALQVFDSLAQLKDSVAQSLRQLTPACVRS